MTDFLTLCRDRFSARKFTDEPVSETDLNYILECVRMAPSAVNFQPWKFVVVNSDEAKARLRQCYSREWFNTAPLYFIAYKDNATAWRRKIDGKLHGDVDVSIAVEHLCLAATERGLGTCWVCNYDTDLMAELFPQPENWEAVAIVPIGHIAVDCPRKEKDRKAMNEIVSFL